MVVPCVAAAPASRHALLAPQRVAGARKSAFLARTLGGLRTPCAVVDPRGALAGRARWCPPPAAPAPAASSRGRAAPPRAIPVEAIQAALTSNSPGLAAGLAFNTAVFVGGISVLLAGLTPWGVANSWALGTAVFSAFGGRGYLLVCLYFIFGSLVTKIKLEQKQAEGIAEARGGRRSPGSVWGSGIAGMACAVAALALGAGAPLEPALRLGFVASFASKLADTSSSEIGKAYGKTTYLSTPPFKRVPRGTEGAVSLEGTAGGACAEAQETPGWVAAGLFSLVALLLGQVDATGCGICVVAAVLANAFESALGATVQGEVAWLNNDVVNMIQITLAAAIAVGLASIMEIL